MKKRQQHYVARFYLSAWATKEQIFCLRGKEIFQTNIKRAATEREFYKLQELTTDDIRAIKLFIDQSDTYSRKVNENFLKMFALPRGTTEEISIPINAENRFAAEIDKLRKEISERIVNAEEDFHSKIETMAAPLINSLRKSDLGFYQDDKLSANFIHYLSVQYFRTNAMKQRMGAISLMPSRYDFNIKRCWNVLSHLFASNIGRSLYLERRKRPLILLKNETAMPFLTGDQPIINLFHSPSITEGPKHIALYYPLSPRLALIIDDPDQHCGFGKTAPTAADVARLNQEIVCASFSSVFANTKEVLLPYR